MCSFIKNVIADAKLVDVAQQGGCTNVFDTLGIQTERFGNFGGVERDAIGMRLAVFFIGQKMLQDNQHAVVAAFQLG